VELAVLLPRGSLVGKCCVLFQFVPKCLNYFMTINGLQQALPDDVCVFILKMTSTWERLRQIINTEAFTYTFWYNLNLIYKRLLNLKNL
jgi:hypothetical protein